MISLRCVARFIEDNGYPCSHPVDVTLTYDPADPYACRITFHEDDDEVHWWFARDLFDTTIHARGHGDVIVRPDGEHMLLRLTSTEGTALLQLPRETVARYMAQSYALVPPDTEASHLDLDLQLAYLLEYGPPGYIGRRRMREEDDHA